MRAAGIGLHVGPASETVDHYQADVRSMSVSVSMSDVFSN